MLASSAISWSVGGTGGNQYAFLHCVHDSSYYLRSSPCLFFKTPQYLGSHWKTNQKQNIFLQELGFSCWRPKSSCCLPFCCAHTSSSSLAQQMTYVFNRTDLFNISISERANKNMRKGGGALAKKDAMQGFSSTIVLAVSFPLPPFWSAYLLQLKRWHKSCTCYVSIVDSLCIAG